MVTVDNEQLELIMDGLERVSFLSLRVAVYEKLYLSCEMKQEVIGQLERSLIPLCKTMLLFMIMAIKRCSQNTAFRAVGALFDPAAVSDLLNSMNSRAEDAETIACNCERFLSHEDRKLQRLATETLVNVDAKIEELWVNLEDEERSKLLQWLSPIHYESDHEFAKTGRVIDTGSWLLRREAFKQWEESSVSGVFWLHGIRTWIVSSFLPTLNCPQYADKWHGNSWGWEDKAKLQSRRLCGSRAPSQKS